MSDAVQDPVTRARQRRKRLIVSVVVASLAVHFAGAIVAGVWVVARYLLPTPATFEVKKEIRIAAEDRQHRMNMDEFDALKPKPTFQDKLSTARPTEFSLPDLPKMPIDAVSTLDPSDIISDQLDGLAGAAGDGSGSGTGGGRGGAISFLGLSSEGRRVVLVFDVSSTVVRAAERAKMPMEKIRDQTAQLIDSLGINTTFGIVQFSRNYAFFENELIPANEQNRAKAKDWLTRWFTVEGVMKQNTPKMVRGGPGFLEVMKEVFKLKPDVVYIIADGDFQRGSSRGTPKADDDADAKGIKKKGAKGNDTGETISYEEIRKTFRDLQAGMAQPVTINFIGVGMKPQNLKDMRSVIRSGQGGNGKFKELD